jgi:hypothetical protein
VGGRISLDLPSIIFYDVIKAFHLHKCNCTLSGINVNKKCTNYFQGNSNNNELQL